MPYEYWYLTPCRYNVQYSHEYDIGTHTAYATSTILVRSTNSVAAGEFGLVGGGRLTLDRIPVYVARPQLQKAR
eukprot:scaffold415569_cov41-Prasinocladus_malaysianus.AAC.1